jgi:hypothetical protein
MKWEKEEIPDQDDVFYRVPIDWTPDGLPHTGVFRENRGSMSVDWEKYSTASESLNRTVTIKPTRIGIMRLNAGKIRQIKGLTLEHEPLDENRAHSAVHGLGAGSSSEERRKRNDLRRELYLRFKSWAIEPQRKE